MPREGFVIRLEEWVDIVALHRQGFSIKAIARQLGISRNAVRRGLRRDGPPVRAPQKRPPSKLEPYKDYLLSRLAEFPELSTVALFEEIQAQGYTGGLTILRNFTRPYRVRRREPVVRFETPPGHQAQVRLGASWHPRAFRPPHTALSLRVRPRLLPGSLCRGDHLHRPSHPHCLPPACLRGSRRHPRGDPL